MGAEQGHRPPGRVRVGEARLGQLLLELARRARDRAWSGAPPSPPRPRSGGDTAFWAGVTAICRHDHDQQRQRHGPRLVHPAPAPRGERDQPRQRQRHQREPAAQLPQVVARVVGELVRDHDADLPVAERPLEERVPEDHAPRRPEADREGVRLVGELVHVLAPAPGCRSTPCSRASCFACAASRSFRRRLQVRSRNGPTKVKQQAEADEHRRRPGSTSSPAERPRQGHHDHDRDADEQEHAAQREEAASAPTPGSPARTRRGGGPTTAGRRRTGAGPATRTRTRASRAASRCRCARPPTRA